MKNFLENSKKVNYILLLLATVGGFVSIYLWDFHIRSSEIVCFTGCESVLSSEYGEIFGVPVAAFGFAFYVAILLMIYIRLQIKHVLFDRLLGILLFWGIAFSLYLRYLEFFVLFDICMWCWVSFIVILVMSLIYYLEAKGRMREILDFKRKK